LTANVTRGVDFLGTADAALRVKGGLTNKAWEFRQVRPGSLSSVAAQLTLQSDDGVKEIDFLGSIIGVHTDDVRKRAVPFDFPDGTAATLLHPLDVLASRFFNLAQIPDKQTETGVAQAELAIGIARAFLSDMIAQGNERLIFRQIERIKVIATNDNIAAVCRKFGLDLLSCVPIDLITNADFKLKRWPQIAREVENKVGTQAHPTAEPPPS
jgi:hypothetical protein